MFVSHLHPTKVTLFSRILRIISSINVYQKMVNEDILKRIQQNNARGEEIVKLIQKEIPLLQKVIVMKQQEKLAQEISEKNLLLKSELEFWKNRVVELEIMSGIKQCPLPSDSGKVNTITEIPAETASTSKNVADISDPKPTPVAKMDNAQSADKVSTQASNPPKKEPSAKENKKEKAGKAAKSDKQPTEEMKEVNVSRLDLRVGRILNVKKHPDAESLYVEEIDLGDSKPRTVVSGLVKFVPLEEMQNRLVVVLCNLKPAKMRGITSEAMVMCASTPEKVEILCPPSNSVPGDRVLCDEYPGEPDSLLPPKKKIFEQIAPDLKTDNDCNATYKSAILKVADKGVVKSMTLTNVQIK